MKVSELKIGMLVQPHSGYFFTKIPKNFHLRLPYLVVRPQSAAKLISADSRDIQVIYLGTRSDVNVTAEDFDWSNRYVMIDGEITAVEPSSWRLIKPVI